MLFERRRKGSQEVAGPRTFVIGDIHGCVDEIDCLLDAIAPGADDQICFLGDYVDRGPSSRGVIDRLLKLAEEGPQCTFLKGNHEDMFLDFLGLGGHHGQAFLWNGGEVTLASYGLEGITGPAVAERIPAEHLTFLRGLETTARFGAFLCVHAGLRPGRALEAQSEEDLYWIREEFISAKHEFPFVILYGHTPQREIRMNLPFHLGLDTGVVYGNLLSCLELRDRELLQVRRGAAKVERRSLAADFESFGIGAP